jgi:hypothetical protein
MRSQLLVAVVLCIGIACRQADTGSPIGTVYQRIARPVVWEVLPRSQAEELGLRPGDLVLSYNDVVLKTNDDLRELQTQMAQSERPIPVVLLRGDEEVAVSVRPGELGFVPDAGRYPSSLSVALEDILGHFGVAADYDWLAGLAGESFTFTARAGVCSSSWPGSLSGTYLYDVARAVGLNLNVLFDAAEQDSSKLSDAVAPIKTALNRGRIVLVRGGWADERDDCWGVATHYDPDDSLVYGYCVGSADEVPLTGIVQEAYEVRRAGNPELDAADMLSDVLVRALEMGQAFSDSGWQSGIAAFDVLIGALDSVPFCPACSSGSQTDLDRLVWALRAHRESAGRFLAEMREELPEQSGLLDEAIADHAAIVAKLDGVIRSGVKVGRIEDQRKIAVAVSEVELIESDLLAVYEDLIGEL